MKMVDVFPPAGNVTVNWIVLTKKMNWTLVARFLKVTVIHHIFGVTQGAVYQGD